MLVEKASTLNKPFSSKDCGHKNVELNSMFKLTMKHITVAGPERQNVRMAAEILSHTTAVNLRRHFGQYEEALLLAEIVEKINAWFDVMNSYQLYNTVPSKKCYGTEIELQKEILDDMVELMTNMRTLTRHSLPCASHLQVYKQIVKTHFHVLRYVYFLGFPKSYFNVRIIIQKSFHHDAAAV